MTKEQVYEYIEKYINGDLEGDELKAFQDKMSTDPSFSEEVRLHQAIQSSISDKQKQALIKSLEELRTSHASPAKVIQFNRTRLIGSIAAIFVFAFAFWFLFLRNPADKADPGDLQITEGKETPAIKPEDSTIRKDLPKSDLAVDQRPSQQQDKVKVDDPQIQKPKIIPDQSNPDRSSYASNDALESLILQNDKIEYYKFSIESPNSDEAYPAEDGKVEFVFAGMLRSSEPVDEQAINIRVFNNDPSSFNNNAPVYSAGIEFEKEEDGGILGFGSEENYFFNHQSALELSKGLFYYVISIDEGTVLFAGKFSVE